MKATAHEDNHGWHVEQGVILMQSTGKGLGCEFSVGYFRREFKDDERYQYVFKVEPIDGGEAPELDVGCCTDRRRR
jgi:hypothetical protein